MKFLIIFYSKIRFKLMISELHNMIKYSILFVEFFYLNKQNITIYT